MKTKKPAKTIALLNIPTLLQALREVTLHRTDDAPLTWQRLADTCEVHRVTMHTTLRAARALLGVDVRTTDRGLRVVSWGLLRKHGVINEWLGDDA